MILDYFVVVKKLSYLMSKIKLSIQCIFSSHYLSLLRRHCYPSRLTRSADRLCLFVTWQLMSTQLFIGTSKLQSTRRGSISCDPKPSRLQPSTVTLLPQGPNNPIYRVSLRFSWILLCLQRL